MDIYIYIYILSIDRVWYCIICHYVPYRWSKRQVFVARQVVMSLSNQNYLFLEWHVVVYIETRDGMYARDYHHPHHHH